MGLVLFSGTKTTPGKDTVVDLIRRADCTGTRQQCELPAGNSDSNTTTIVVAVVIPVAVCLLIISFFVFKSYRKGKEEALEDDDPDFNGDNTVLPDIDMDYYQNHGQSKFPRQQEEANPFEYGELKYPNNVYSNQPRYGSPYNHSTFFNHENGSRTTSGRHIDSFVLPFGEQTESKKSLDDFARGLPTEYSAYAQAISPDQSRSSSMTRSVHPFSRSTDLLSKTNLSQMISSDDYDTKNSSSFAETKELVNEKIDSKSSHDMSHSSQEIFKDSRSSNNSFKDTSSEIALSRSRPVSGQSINTEHLMQNLDSNLNLDDGSVKNAHIADTSMQTLDEDEDLNDPSLTTEEREKLRRMKSIYNVYFDREKSIKHKRKENNEEVVLPPLPSLPTIETPDMETIEDFKADESPVEAEENQNLTINTNFDRNYASSVYPENPLDNYEPYQQHIQQQQYNQQYYQQQYPQGQYLQQYSQGQYPQGQYPQTQYPQQQRRMQQPPAKLKTLAKLPTPSELNQRPYSSANFYTEYQPKMSFKASSSPKLSTVPQGFNPMDQWDPNNQQRNVTPTLISRNSVAIIDPTIITKTKLYKPAGSVAKAANEYVRNSPQMSQAPSFGPQSPIYDTQQFSPTEVSGSRQDFQGY